MKNYLVLVSCLCSFFSSYATELLWFTAYHYDGPFIVSKPLSFFQSEVAKHSGEKKVMAYVSLANKYYLDKDFEHVIKILNEAVDYTSVQTDTNVANLRYGLYNLLVERSHFTGHYELSYHFIKQYLQQIPEYRLEYALMKLNRMKVVAKSFYLENTEIQADECAFIAERFLQHKAYSPYIEAILIGSPNYTKETKRSHYESLFTVLPSPFKEEALMNMYYQFEGTHPEYLKRANGIPESNYLAWFRWHIALSLEAIKHQDSTAALMNMKRCYSVIKYLGDVEVELHYNGHYEMFRDAFKTVSTLPPMIKIISKDIPADRIIASNLAARDLLIEARKAVLIEQEKGNRYLWGLLLLLILLLFILVYTIYVLMKLRKANEYRQWFITALSHDLRSPVAQIACALKETDGKEKAEDALMNYEYLLDDTLDMALRAQQISEAEIIQLDLKQLIEEVLLDLSFLVRQKSLQVSETLPDDCLVRGDVRGLKVLFRNLILNAIKHNYQGGLIEIGLLSERPVSVSIWNTSKASASTQHSTGSNIIAYFVKQNKLQHSLEIQEGRVEVKLGFRE